MRSVRRMCACTAGVAVLFGGVAMTTGSVAVAASKSAARFVAVRSSSARTTDPPVGRFAGSRMSVEVVLAPQNQTALTSRLAASCRCRNRANQRKNNQRGQQAGEPDQWADVEHTSSVVMWTV